MGFKLRYHLKPEAGDFTDEQIKSEGAGGSDALIVISMRFPPTGEYSQMHFSIDGRNECEDVPAADEFKAWLMMGAALSKRPDLDEGRRLFAEHTFRSFMDLLKQAPEAPQEGGKDG